MTLKELQQEKLSVASLTTLLADAVNEEADEFNTVCDALDVSEAKVTTLALSNQLLLTKVDDSRKENEALLKEYTLLSDSADLIMDNGKKHLAFAEQAKREKEQALDKAAKTTMLLSQYKPLGTPKKVREQLKAYKEKALETAKVIKNHKQMMKDNRRDMDLRNKRIQELELELKVTCMSSVYSEGKDNLMIFPSKLTMEVKGEQEEQLTLLYMDGSGCGKLIGLDDENEPMLCVTPKGGLRPKASTMALAGEMLRKLKRQGWRANTDDLNMAGKS